MLIQGSALSERTTELANTYINLLENDVEASEILVLCLNSFKKNIFTDYVKAKLSVKHYENPQIYTFYGLVYNTIMNNWTVVESHIKEGFPVIIPNLSGLEISQLFFKSAVKEVGFKDYNSKINLMHQLFRRYSLIANNNLTDREVALRSGLLGESFALDAGKAIDIYKKKTLEYRAFDYIRQLGLFNHIYKNTYYFKNIKYLIIDDADEITQCEFDFIKYLKPQLKKAYVGYDRHGSSRLGFLNTDCNIVKNIEELFKNEEYKSFDDIGYKPVNAQHFAYTRRLEMLNSIFEQASKLIESGVKPSDIAIITPIIDKSLKFSAAEIFGTKNIGVQYFSGSEKLCSTPLVQNMITLLNISIGNNQDVFKIRSLVNGLLKIPVRYCMQIVSSFKENGEIRFCDIGVPDYNIVLQKLIDTLNQIKNPQMPLSEKIFCIYKNLVYIQKEEFSQLEAFNFFVKQIQDFENVFPEHKTKPVFQKTFLQQLENSIISENPSSAPELKDDCIIVSTAQKLIDFAVKTKYQFWLDITSSDWIRDDFGTLYNAWVFQKSWNKNDFTYEDNLELSSLKVKKQLRKLSLLCKEKIFAYSSLFDMEGNENFGGIESYIGSCQSSSEKINFNFVPREDQKPVLNYHDGNMAISAVPGAGKTTILLALIIKLLKDGVKSENIFVLTYMDSAARNFKERIKNACPSLEKMPNISTIHGLALRILKENSNFVKVGLDDDFEVCDDNERQRIIREIMFRMQIEQEDFDKYEKAVSLLKLSGLDDIPFTKDNELKKFLKFYTLYNNSLKNRNIIDYDDMLSYCVQLLEENKDIAAYYQDICRYVIEDEAQDSSYIQQKLLGILSAKFCNLIRCGDINQAITTTFTNADLDGFKNFVSVSNNVEMNRSQRCAKDIYTLANKIIDYAKTNENLKDSFYDIKMQGVQGKNPDSQDAVQTALFENYKQEQSFILEKVRNIFSFDRNASVAILVRNNYQIQDYCSFLSDYGYSVMTRNDTLEAQPVFSLIYAVLRFCSHPWQNENVLKILDILRQQKLFSFSAEDYEFIKDLKTPFILLNENNLDSKNLIQFLWDMNYWLESSILECEELALKIGNYYYNSELEKSNVYMVALLLKRLSLQYRSTDVLLEQLEELSKKPVLSKYKFFAEDSSTQNGNSRVINIMTYHKSKGDEFDYVFLPQMCEDTLPFDIKNIKIKSKERFLEAVKALNLNYCRKDEIQQKRFIAGENMRLLYVAVTRAKKKLYITSAAKYKKFSKLKDVTQSVFFNNLPVLPEKNTNDS